MGAHVELARAEFGEISGEISRLAAAAGIALSMLLGIGIILPVGLLLFLGEWLFGSIGWGVLDGVFLLAGIATAALVGAISPSRGALLRAFLTALLVGVFVGIVLAFGLASRAWAPLADSSLFGLPLSVGPFGPGVIALAIVGALVGLVAGARSGIGGAIGGLFGGAILGAVLGAISSASFTLRVGAAFGLTTGLVLWPLLTAADLLQRGIDIDAFKKRFTPTATIETTKETIEWVRAQTPLGPKS